MSNAHNGNHMDLITKFARKYGFEGPRLIAEADDNAQNMDEMWAELEAALGAILVEEWRRELT